MTQFLLPELLEQCCDQAPPSRSLPAAFRTADARILGPVVPAVVFWLIVVPYVDAACLSHDHYTAAVRTVRLTFKARCHPVPVRAARGVVAQPEVMARLQPDLQDALRAAAAKEFAPGGSGKERIPVVARSEDFHFMAASQLRLWAGGLRRLTLQHWNSRDVYIDALLHLFRGSSSGTATLECLTLRNALVTPDLIFCIAESCPRLQHLSLLNCFSVGPSKSLEITALTVRAVARAQWRGLETLTMIGRFSRHVLLSQLFLHCCAEELRHRTGFCGNVIIPPRTPADAGAAAGAVKNQARRKGRCDRGSTAACTSAPVPLYKSLVALTTGSADHATSELPLCSDLQRLVLACPSLRVVSYGVDRLSTTDAPLSITDWHTYNSPLYAEEKSIALKRAVRCDMVRQGKGKPPLQQKKEAAVKKTADKSSFYSWTAEMRATGTTAEHRAPMLLPFLRFSAKQCANLPRPDVRSRGRAAIRAAVNGPLPPHDVLVAHSAKLQRLVQDLACERPSSVDPKSNDIADVLSRDTCELFAAYGLVSSQLPLLQAELQELRKAQHVASKRRREARLAAKLGARSSGVWSSPTVERKSAEDSPIDKEAMAELSAADVGAPVEAVTGHVMLYSAPSLPADSMVHNMLIE